MAQFRKLVAPYKTVVDELSLPDDFYKISDRDGYKKQIEKDKIRVPMLDFYSTKKKMQDYLTDDSKLKDDELSFTQGDWHAANFSDSIISPKLVGIMNSEAFRALDDKQQTAITPSLGFCYINDQGQYCGFCIAPLLNTNNQPYQPPFLKDDKTHQYVLAHIQDVEKPLKERVVTVLMSKEVMPDTSPKGQPFNKEFGEDFDSRDIPRVVTSMLNSSSISKLLSGVIDKDGALDVERFVQIKQRIENSTNLNVDNRDRKMEICIEIIFWAKHTWNKLTPQAQQELKLFISEVLNDEDYFSKVKIEDLQSKLQALKMVYGFIKQPTSIEKTVGMQSIAKEIDDFLAIKKECDASIHRSVMNYEYHHYQDWLEQKKQPYRQRIPNFWKYVIAGLAITVAVGICVATQILPLVAIAAVGVALMFFGLLWYKQKKLEADDKQLEKTIEKELQSYHLTEKTQERIDGLLIGVKPGAAPALGEPQGSSPSVAVSKNDSSIDINDTKTKTFAEIIFLANHLGSKLSQSDKNELKQLVGKMLTDDACFDRQPQRLEKFRMHLNIQRSFNDPLPVGKQRDEAIELIKTRFLDFKKEHIQKIDELKQSPDNKPRFFRKPDETLEDKISKLKEHDTEILVNQLMPTEAQQQEAGKENIRPSNSNR